MLALCALAAGALGCDPCSGAPGACIALTVDGPASASIDRLEVTVTDSAGEHHGIQTGASHALPVHTLLELADGITGTLTVEVQGFAGADAIGSGTTEVSLPAGGHTSAEVRLGPPTTNADGGGADLVDCPTGAIFCDNCERGLNLPWLPTQIGDGGVIATETDNAHSPITAFQFIGVGDTGLGESYLTTSFQGHATGIVAVRFFLSSLTSIPNGTAVLGFSNDIRLRSLGNTWEIDWSTGTAASNFPIPSLPFVCLEMDVDLDQQTISLYNGNDLPLSGTAMNLGTISSLSIGLIDLPMGASALIEIDDIVIDTKHIGCN